MKELHLFVPQWQDSGFTNEIFHGSHAIRRMLDDRLRFVTVTVAERGELAVEQGVVGYRVILEQLRQVRATLEREAPDSLFTLGGGCGVEVPIVSYLRQRHPELKLFWFDAHGDINSPATSVSGYFHGMPLRFLTEPVPDNDISALVAQRVDYDDLLLIGTRDLDAPEREFIEKHGIAMMTPGDGLDNETADRLIRRGEERSSAYVHIDLDVLDPREFRNVKCPAPGGMSIECVAHLIGLIKKRHHVAGVSLLENMETDPARLRALDPIIDALIDP